jgi:REP element-mobilizing transposase RayT
MPQSLSNVILHIVFSTKDRHPFLDSAIRERMHGYLASLCRDLGSTCYKVGGVADHVHVVTSLPRTLTQSDLLENIKKKSSKWIKEIDRTRYGKFAWQRGYGAFSVSSSKLDGVVDYVVNQEEHHRKQTFQDEYRRLLAKHGIEYDETYVWD